MDSADPSAWSVLAWRVAATFIGLSGAFIARRVWHKTTKEYDRSMLIRIGTDDDSPYYANAPIIVGQYPFSELAGRVQSNLDTRNVIGFVVGQAKWMEVEDLRRLRIVLNQKFHTRGYYAYCVIQWEHAAFVKRLADQWFHIRRTRYDGPEVRAGMRERIFIGFGTNAKPDEETNDLPLIAHIKVGMFASFKYQPYLRGGFRAEDIAMRALAPQTKLLIRCKDIFTKEWRNA